ncbi:MAG: hypothetical protein JO271_16635 [Verrucomicrobia bacterium]|jgi:hypothetical protein|nr:hypothetical protein [Verrucomicrobiota bacterium]MBV9276234.1 hypothetical protein [Verrucomicrobiota bacterium]
MENKIIYFSPKAALSSRTALRSAVLENGGRAETLLGLWIVVWAVLATVECISQIGLVRLY